MKKIKLVLYWVTLIPALADLVTGAINGVKKGVADIKSGKTIDHEKQLQKWLQANRPEQE